MKIALTKTLIAAATVLSFSVLPVSAAPKNQANNNIGYDISYPQCFRVLPTKQAFGIVGVNGGLANTTNSCLVKQLQWANNSTGQTSQPKVQLYVNTANPGGLDTPSWPKDNLDAYTNTPANPYGNCDGSNSLACSWKYGWDRALEDVGLRFVPAAYQAGISSNAASYTWWLDVETINTWQAGGEDSTQKNAAALEGMAAYFQSLGAKVGLYSTTAQWGQIAGSVTQGSNLTGLPNWRPGARSLNSARSNCGLPPLTAGGKVVITQYLMSNLDYNYSCIN
jgi:hypothetical protein